MKESSTTVVVVAVLAAVGLAGWFLLGRTEAPPSATSGPGSASSGGEEGPGAGATEVPGPQRTVTLAVAGMT